MVKNKNSAANGTVGLVNGSMAVAKQAAKVKQFIRKRHFLNKLSIVEDSAQVLSGSQSKYPVGSQFSAGTLLFSASSLSANAQAWIQTHDKFRISQVEIFATLVSRSKTGGVDRTVPVEVYFYEDTDADPATLTSWIRLQDRDNIGRVVLNALHPSMKLAAFKPTPTFAAGSQAQDTANLIPSKNTWLDALSLNQLYAGFRTFTACAQTDTTGQSYDYSVAYTVRYTIEASQPI